MALKKHSCGFNESIYRIALRIPRGKVATYGQLAAMSGNPRAARAVGAAMQNAPEYMEIPCHRVVSSTGKLAPQYAFGGEDKQRALLASEGVVFKENGTIDLKKSLWRP